MAFSDQTENPFNTVERDGMPFFQRRFEAHHIIPKSVFDNLDDEEGLGRFLRDLEIGRDDSDANRFWLPTDPADALTLGSPVHSGRHDAYTEFVQAKLQEIKDK